MKVQVYPSDQQSEAKRIQLEVTLGSWANVDVLYAHPRLLG